MIIEGWIDDRWMMEGLGHRGMTVIPTHGDHVWTTRVSLMLVVGSVHIPTPYGITDDNKTTTNWTILRRRPITDRSESATDFLIHSLTPTILIPIKSL